ncbi:MAG TPA: DUF6510 family protein [Candidatus Limnocylindria bacterium]
MTEYEHRDGNALGGLLLEAFGREMTDADACCGNCHRVNQIGGMLLYQSGPGDVLRCPNCATVVMVATARPDGTRFYFAQLTWMQPRN